MLLHGETGTGKTYAAAWVFEHWPRKFDQWNQGPHDEPIMVDCQEECAQIAQMRRDGCSGSRFKKIADCTLLVLDEIGRRQMTEPQLDVLLDIINRRGPKPTILTSNKSPLELVKVLGDQRIVDRILTTFQFLGTSQRKVRREKG